MPSSVLIILVAVVVLIVVVVYGGMRYLRSDDDDEFDAAERGSGRANQVPAAAGRRRRAHDDFDAARDLPRPAARSGRDAQAGQTGPRREARGSRAAYPDDDRTELVPVGGHASRPGRAAASDDGPRARQRTQPAGFERDGRDFGNDGPGRSGGRAIRTAPAVRELAVADLDELDRRSAARSAGKPDGTKDARGARERQTELLPQVKPRPNAKQGKSKSKGKSKKDADGEWPSNEWDELSDVDYWTELASDKPFTGDAPAASRNGRSGRRASRESPTQRIDQVPLPSAGRGHHRQARDRGDDLTTPRHVSSGRSERTEEFRSEPRRSEPMRSGPARSEPARSQPAPSEPRRAAGGSRHAAPMDDDPLTSPSFPRVAANDSRSYRRSHSGSHERPAPDYAAAPTSYDQPAAAYGGPAAEGYRDAPGRYPTAAGYDQRQPSQGAAPASGYGASQPDPLAGYRVAPAQYGMTSGYGPDPLGYGSYNGQGQPDVGYLAYPDQVPPAGYGAGGYGGYAASAEGIEGAYRSQQETADPYSATAASTAPYYYQAPSAQQGHRGEHDGYAGADPYAADPYGYSGYGNRSH